MQNKNEKYFRTFPIENKEISTTGRMQHRLKFPKSRRTNFEVLSMPGWDQVFNLAQFPWRQLNKSQIFKTAQ